MSMDVCIKYYNITYTCDFEFCLLNLVLGRVVFSNTFISTKDND